MTKQNRIYLKCSGCLSTSVIEKENNRYESLAPCELCGSELLVMGQVIGSNYGQEWVGSVCDERCTNAPGPKCSCRCGGVNHGTQFVTTYTKIDGKIVIHSAPSEEAQKIKAEWDSAKRDYLVECHGLCPQWEDSAQGKWIQDKSQWWRIMRLKQALREAQKMKSQKGRLSKLAKAVELENRFLCDEKVGGGAL